MVQNSDDYFGPCLANCNEKWFCFRIGQHFVPYNRMVPLFISFYRKSSFEVVAIINKMGIVSLGSGGPGLQTRHKAEAGGPEFKVSLVHSEFQDSQGCGETLSLETEQDNWCCLIPVFSSDSNGVEMNFMYNVYLFVFHLFYEENLWSVLLF